MMTCRQSVRRLVAHLPQRIIGMRPGSLIAGLWRDARAVSAIEFALLLPFMLILYIAGNEVGQSIAIYRKVAQVAYTLGDLVTQVSTVSATDISNIMAASTAVMMPYSASNAQIVLSAVTYTGGAYSVAWSKSQNTAAWSVGSAPPATISIPTTLLSTGQQLIVAQVNYTYSSAFTSVMTKIWGSDSITLSNSVYLKPRLSDTISYTN